jgi:hypothetical protein
VGIPIGRHGIIKTRLIALFWGLGEATWFFVVPDVWLTFVARRRLGVGLVASVYALAGALIGGTIMYAVGREHAEPMGAFLEAIPGISAEMIAQANARMAAHTNGAVLVAPIFGIPSTPFPAHLDPGSTRPLRGCYRGLSLHLEGRRLDARQAMGARGLHGWVDTILRLLFLGGRMVGY